MIVFQQHDGYYLPHGVAELKFLTRCTSTIEAGAAAAVHRRRIRCLDAWAVLLSRLLRW